jgi:hypothetical protein
VSQPPEQVASLRALEPVPVLEPVRWQAPQLVPPHSMPIDLPVEVLPEPLKRPLRSWEPPVSSSCILQEQEPWSEQTLLPGFVGLRACTFSLVLQISVAIYSR